MLLILMAAGFLSFKLRITTKEAAAYFSSFVLKITLPCLILNSFRRPFSRELLGEAGTTLIVACIIYGFAIFLAWVYPHVLKMKGSERGVHRYAIIVSNAGFIGFPVVEAILGPLYLFHASIYNVPSNILAFSVGVWLVAKEGNKAPAFSWRILVTPAMVCTIGGFIMFLFSVPLPRPLEEGIRLAGSMTTPLSMAVIGISIAQADIRRMLGHLRVYATVLMRLLVIPALIFLACYIASIRGPLLMLPVILGAMPAGSTTSIMASVYDVAVEEASSIVALSTIMSAITIPLIVIVMHYLG